MTLFRTGDFTLHSGDASDFLIDCEALTDEDLANAATQIAARIPPFGFVIGVPQGGIRLALALTIHATDDDDAPILIVDDVLTTGGSMEEMRSRLPQILKERAIMGVVLFARGPTPKWVWPLFTMSPGTLRDGRTG